MQSPPF